MSQWEKLIERLYSMSSDFRFEELALILTHYGYKMSDAKGSHVTFRKMGVDLITVPKKSPVKKVYVRLIRDRIMKEDKNGENG